MILLDRFETLIEGFRHLLELSVHKKSNMTKGAINFILLLISKIIFLFRTEKNDYFVKITEKK